MDCAVEGHEAEDLARDSDLIRYNILLDTKTGKEGEDQVGEHWALEMPVLAALMSIIIIFLRTAVLSSMISGPPESQRGAMEICRDRAQGF